MLKREGVSAGDLDLGWGWFGTALALALALELELERDGTMRRDEVSAGVVERLVLGLGGRGFGLLRPAHRVMVRGERRRGARCGPTRGMPGRGGKGV